MHVWYSMTLALQGKWMVLYQPLTSKLWEPFHYSRQANYYTLIILFCIQIETKFRRPNRDSFGWGWSVIVFVFVFVSLSLRDWKLYLLCVSKVILYAERVGAVKNNVYLFDCNNRIRNMHKQRVVIQENKIL